MPGVLRAVRESAELDRIVVGLDRLLGLVDSQGTKPAAKASCSVRDE